MSKVHRGVVHHTVYDYSKKAGWLGSPNGTGLS
jgi:hypothetical protein